MKIAVVLMACVFVYVASESCTSSSGACKATMCVNSTVHCVDNLCTCLTVHSHQACSLKTDCTGIGERHCRMDASGQPILHCIDGQCHCEHRHGP
ncbi:serine protease inhibitor Cvsi-2-like [Ruditapes philippinarum]|uniref:serine protease inhibitor Cvsi-2-like n=1 Tax=Ruditapes philippinarum TaxID=129788 RepID=UPI00295B0AB3|nr:serine protease inhibitor Cvsi-2-like [Ruditapes philippinarum]